jgi:LPXTG-motif cell wall-anchored protein
MPGMRRTSIRLVFLFAMLAWSFVGASPAGASTVSLSVHDFAFSPATLTIPVGTTVKITNTGDATHTWSSDPGATQHWDSGDIEPGSSFSVTFNQAGRFGYHCNIHSFMTGTIVVVASTPPTTTTRTTAPPTTTAPSNPSPTTATAAAVPATSPPTTPPKTAVRATALPHTGAHSTTLVALAAALTLLGVALVASGARRRRLDA